MRRRDEAPQIKWRYVLIIVAGVILLIMLGAPLFKHGRERRSPYQRLAGPECNEATAEELQTLPGIGPARAERIIQNRPYQSVDGLFEKRALPKTVVDANPDK